RGQPIALSGDTGFADQPEVHFELRKGRTPVDPQTQLRRS
ncbi:MAG TPA: M23 family metallopeptidase, partial [Sphingomonas sp.]|nr:M23 family metallopeptidase [Sphingomonas sp.]